MSALDIEARIPCELREVGLMKKRSTKSFQATRQPHMRIHVTDSWVQGTTHNASSAANKRWGCTLEASATIEIDRVECRRGTRWATSMTCGEA